MKLIFFLAFITPNLAPQTNVEVLRELFASANTVEADNVKLLELTENAVLEKNPLEYAYHAGGLMSMANHTYWPGTKLAYFNKGKVKLNKAVNFAFQNVEIRFIRYAIQKNAPAMLGYDSKLQEDKAFILEKMSTTNWSEKYKQEVKNFLNN